jgi:hypothetical protein
MSPLVEIVNRRETAHGRATAEQHATGETEQHARSYAPGPLEV